MQNDAKNVHILIKKMMLLHTVLANSAGREL